MSIGAVDFTVHESATVEKLMDTPGLDSDDLWFLWKQDELVYLDCVQETNTKSGLGFISKEFAEMLGMKKGQRGQLQWLPYTKNKNGRIE